MKSCMERLYNGLIKENPTFVLMLGMCPTLAVTTSAINGLGMGLSTMVVLALSNMIISALRKIIPDKVRIPAYIVIIATFVTIVELLMHAFVPGLYSALGIYISLIVVNCIILGRAESYASKNPVLPSLFDGIGMGLGFTMALTIIGLVREFLGAGTLFGFAIDDMTGNPLSVVFVDALNKAVSPSSTGFKKFISEVLTIEFSSISPIGILVMAPGAFFVLATLTMIQNIIKDKGAKKGLDTSKIGSGCSSDCMNCSDMGCAHRMVDNTVKEEVKVENKTEKVLEEAKDNSSEESLKETLKESSSKTEITEAEEEKETSSKKETEESSGKKAKRGASKKSKDDSSKNKTKESDSKDIKEGEENIKVIMPEEKTDEEKASKETKPSKDSSKKKKKSKKSEKAEETVNEEAQITDKEQLEEILNGEADEKEGE